MEQLAVLTNPCFFATAVSTKSVVRCVALFILVVGGLATFEIEASAANAIRELPGCSTNTLPANDDSSTGAVPLPFPIDYFGEMYSQLFVNNNGNITFTGPLGTFTPFNLNTTTNPIIAPFFADVDTRGPGSGQVQYGTDTVEGRTAFCVNWVNVGYFSGHTDKLNSFQLLLIDRSDTGAGNFDIEFNYDQIVWETGDASGGSNGLGGNSARAGYANGTNEPGTFFELPGSAVNGGLLDSNPETGLTNNSLNSGGVLGRYVFSARNGGIEPTEPPEPACELICSAMVPGRAGQNEQVAFASELRIEPDTCELFLPSYQWSFGDGTSSNEQNPVKAYSEPGRYQWQVTIFSGDRSCSESGQITILCTLDCQASVPAQGVQDQAVRFSVAAEADPACNLPAPSFLWEFGDGTTSTQQNPDKSYSTAGTYDWTVTVTRGAASCTTSGRIAISAPCALNCGASVSETGIEGQVIAFAANATPSPACPLDGISYRWTFGDETFSTEQSPAKVYDDPGTYTWQLTTTIGGVTCVRSGQVVVARAPAVIAVTNLPDALVQPTTGGSTTSYTVQNVGGTAAQVTITQTGNFFMQSPTSFLLEPGASQVVTVTGLATAAGAFEGAAHLSGNGVPAGLSVPIVLQSSEPPDAPVNAMAEEPRIDVASDPGESPTGTANFTNTGTETIQGVLSSDVPWIIPQPGTITILPGETVTVSFTIDPSLRGDGEYGTAVGSLFLEYLDGTSGKMRLHSSHGRASAAVPIHHTSSPGSQAGQIPPLEPGEVAIFLPGVANVTGSVGPFVSDIALTNLTGVNLTGVNLYFREIDGSRANVSRLNSVLPGRPLILADVAKSVFDSTSSLGTLQIRSNDADRLSATASVFNTVDAEGTVGTALPAFRSDRSAGSGEQTFLTGLQSDASTHTNIYVQEVTGNPVTVSIDFFDADGSSRGGRTEMLEAFGLRQLGDSVPDGAVSAVLTTSEDSSGRVVAYATPVDEASGDTWAMADWRRQYGVLEGASVIPVAASVEGGNNAKFLTDVWMLNTGEGTATGTLTFRSRTGDRIEQPVELAPRQSLVLRDIVESEFGVSDDTVGYLLYSPDTGGVVLTSRTYTSVEGGEGTVGSSVPSVPMSIGLTEGQTKRFGGVDDASMESIVMGRAGTYRTNLGLVEVGGEPVTVRLTLSFKGGTQPAATQARVARTFELGAGEFMQLNEISRELIPSRDIRYEDLRNMQLDIQVIGGAGAIIPFISSLDNGSDDSIIRMD